MSDEFDVMFESTSECCGDEMHWEWNDVELYFQSECSCMRRYTLRPVGAEIEHESEEFDHDDE